MTLHMIFFTMDEPFTEVKVQSYYYGNCVNGKTFNFKNFLTFFTADKDLSPELSVNEGHSREQNDA